MGPQYSYWILMYDGFGSGLNIIQPRIMLEGGKNWFSYDGKPEEFWSEHIAKKHGLDPEGHWHVVWVYDQPPMPKTPQTEPVMVERPAMVERLSQLDDAELMAMIAAFPDMEVSEVRRILATYQANENGELPAPVVNAVKEVTGRDIDIERRDHSEGPEKLH